MGLEPVHGRGDGGQTLGQVIVLAYQPVGKDDDPAHQGRGFTADGVERA
ncbi:hypothetical protein Misp01_67270 [Microtetraspora sp. NBRC 13810]|nr:hypothetical protein Misp01_67270 [Microtetraspora sp. NBRC 13810]